MLGNNLFLNTLVSISIVYFIFLIFATITRYYITNRGFLYTITFILGSLFTTVLLSFNTIVFEGNFISWKFSFGQADWALPELGLNILVDTLSYFFILLVLAIGFATNIYTLNYMKHEGEEVKFLLLLNWFIVSMLLLVSANNFYTLFLGWEAIGLTSFFLINFWTYRRATLKSAFKAMTFNKISDFFLFMALIILWSESQTSNIRMFLIFIDTSIVPYSFNLYLATLCLIICSSIKSAQLFGHLWLPDSMEAPVPASALIHSATLVSAGVYLLLRFNLLVNLCELQNSLLVLGSLTAAYGGVVAAAQTDMKKLLAYSTISHCGFLFVCLGFNNHTITIIYLFMHGVFKALAFFAVGTYIRVAGTQDTRRMGILNKIIPADTLYLMIAIANLGGLPFTFGYLYKHLFLTQLLITSMNIVSLGLCVIGMLSSVVYCYRLVYYSAFDYNKNNPYYNVLEAQDSLNKIINKWSLSTITQHIAFYILLLFIIYIYIIFSSIFITSGIVLDSFPIKLSYNPVIPAEVHTLYEYGIYLFYTLYIITIIVISITDNRSIYTWSKKIYAWMYLYLIIIIIFFLM